MICYTLKAEMEGEANYYTRFKHHARSYLQH